MALGPNLCPNGDFELDENWEFFYGTYRESASPPPGGSGWYARLVANSNYPAFATLQQDLTGIVELDVLYEIDFDFAFVSNYGMGAWVHFGGSAGEYSIGKMGDVPLQGSFVSDCMLRFRAAGMGGDYIKIDNIQLREIFAMQMVGAGLVGSMLINRGLVR